VAGRPPRMWDEWPTTPRPSTRISLGGHRVRGLS